MPPHMVPHSHLDHDGHHTATGIPAHVMKQFLEEERHEKDALGRPVHPGLQRR